MAWNFGDMLDVVATCIPGDSPAFIHGTRTISWSEFDRASNNLARGLIARAAPSPATSSPSICATGRNI